MGWPCGREWEGRMRHAERDREADCAVKSVRLAMYA